MNSLGIRLRQLRGNRKQSDISKALGIGSSSYTMYENDQRQPNYDMLCKLADFYNVTTDYLLGRTECKSPDIEVQAMCEKTGLSNEAVGVLLKNRHSSLSYVLDKLLKEGDFQLALIELFDAIDIADNDPKSFVVQKMGDKPNVTLGGKRAADYFIQQSWLAYWAAAKSVVYKKEQQNAET